MSYYASSGLGGTASGVTQKIYLASVFKVATCSYRERLGGRAPQCRDDGTVLKHSNIGATFNDNTVVTSTGCDADAHWRE
jgi:hypothetical protein